MAEIFENDPEQRESWLQWLVAFLKRGLRPKGSFIVHGPHPRTSYMWGEAECKYAFGYGVEIEFTTSECYSISVVKGLRVRDKNSRGFYPKIKTSRLSESWREELTKVQKELRKLKKWLR